MAKLSRKQVCRAMFMAPSRFRPVGLRLVNSIAPRLRHAASEYAVVFGYLYLCFATLLFYKAAILRANGIEYYPYGFAAGKALILAKFIVVGHKLHIGANLGRTRPILAVLKKSAVFFVILVGLSAIEAWIVAWVHDRSPTVVGVFRSGKLAEMVATALLLFLILLPYFACRELDSRLGRGQLVRVLFGKPISHASDKGASPCPCGRHEQR